MRKFITPVFLVISLLLLGCPYQSDVEINTYETSLKADKNLFDVWVSFKEDRSRFELFFEKIAKTVVNVSYKEYDSNSRFKSKDKYRGYATDLGGYTVFNLEGKDGKYMFCKFSWISKNEFNIQMINEDFVVNNFKPEDEITSENLRAFLLENVNEEKMYDEVMEFYRKDSPEYSKVKMYMQKSGF